MEEKIKSLENFGVYKELQETEELYISCLNTSGFNIKYPSTKYAVYHYKIYLAYKAKIKKIKGDLETIMIKLDNYKGNKIDPTIEKDNLKTIIDKLNVLLKKADKNFNYNEKLLIVIGYIK